jgi:alpha-ribazole phosphatase
MDILVVRHTRIAVDPSLCYGNTDVPLANTFPNEAAEVKNRLTQWFPFEKVYSSPLTRALKLAQYLQDDRSVIQDDRLKEINFGEWEMKTWSQIGLKRFSSWVENTKERAPSIENYSDVTARIMDFFNDLIERRPAEKILIVTHSGPMRCILARYSGAPLSNLFTFRIDYGGILHLKYQEFEHDYEKYPKILLPKIGIKGFNI